MRRKLIAGNWKMNTDRAAAVAGARRRRAGRRAFGTSICWFARRPCIWSPVARCAGGHAGRARRTRTCITRRTARSPARSAPRCCTDVGCSYVILGHSERRHILGETDADVNKKTLAALAAGLVPIVCVGELLAEREAGKRPPSSAASSRARWPTFRPSRSRTVIAYEPVWAIGTGKVATPEQAEEVHADLRRLLAERYNDGPPAKVRILYGGSVKPATPRICLSAEHRRRPGRRRALKADDFLGIAAGASS